MSNPLVQQDRSGAPAADPASRDPFSIPSEIKASIRVLVVDDERTLRESCASVSWNAANESSTSCAIA